MKNIQVIDSAANCTFSIYQATDVEFALIFPAKGQDIEFAEDMTRDAVKAVGAIWKRPIWKADAQGIHGTLFYQFESKRDLFPSSKKERDWDFSSLNQSQRSLYKSK